MPENLTIKSDLEAIATVLEDGHVDPKEWPILIQAELNILLTIAPLIHSIAEKCKKLIAERRAARAAAEAANNIVQSGPGRKG